MKKTDKWRDELNTYLIPLVEELRTKYKKVEVIRTTTHSRVVMNRIWSVMYLLYIDNFPVFIADELKYEDIKKIDKRLKAELATMEEDMKYTSWWCGTGAVNARMFANEVREVLEI